MTAIWHSAEGKWSLLQPVGFQDEATLHTLAEATPELLPLAGSPLLAILGREVRLGAGAADLVGIEANGRLAIIEIKLKANPEARRAVVAQVLAYAAYLHRMSFDELESTVLASHLVRRGFSTIADALSNLTQSPVDAAELRASVEENLATGAFRLVLVLDEVPTELVRVVGYLQAIGSNIVIDLISISAYDVNGDRVVVPQRVEPERVASAFTEVRSSKGKQDPVTVPGSADFVAAIASAAAEDQPNLRRLADWADGLAMRGLAVLATTHGVWRKTLRVRVKGTDAGMVTVVTDSGGSLWLWPTVLVLT